MLTASRVSLGLASAVALLLTTACSSPTITGIKLTAGPAAQSIAAGGTSYIDLSATTTASAPINAAIVVYNLPTGVSFSPASPTITTGSATRITLSAAPATIPTTAQIQISAYTGLAASDAYINLTVVPNP